MTPFPRNAGFTLIEMVMVITITAILGAVVAVFIVRPIESYQRLSLRGTLVDAAESSLRRMAGDIRNALPNSVRITNSGSGFALEMIPILDGAKYNTTGTASAKLVFNGDSDFDLIGTFPNAATLTTTGIRLVINNLGTTGNDVYADAGGVSSVTGVITSTDTAIAITTVTGNHHINLSPQYDFKGSSSTNQHLYVVTRPVSYLCDLATGQLTRYANYPIQAAQPSSVTALNALATPAQVVGNVSGCSLSTAALDVRNRGVATIALSLSYQGEQITLIQQTGLNNSR